VPVLLQGETDVVARYQAYGTPTGYLIDDAGRLASGLAVGSQALLALAGAAGAEVQPAAVEPAHAGTPRATRPPALMTLKPLTESRLKRDGLRAGTPAPTFTLPTLDGGELSFEALPRAARAARLQRPALRAVRRASAAARGPPSPHAAGSGADGQPWHFILPFGIATSLLVTGCELNAKNSNPPEYVKDVVAYKEGSEGLMIYFVLADASGAPTSTDGEVTVTIVEERELGTVKSTLWEMTITVTRSDFQDTMVGRGPFERKTILCPIGRIPYSSFRIHLSHNWHRPHASLHDRPPISHLASADNLVRLHS
jgi:hypothetical protein